MNHSFNVELAMKYGIEEAILIENFAFWIKKNAANGVNYVDGEYWTYNTAKALEELFPYMNLKKIQRILVKLEELKILKSDNFNKKAYDRTKWYCIIDPEIKNMYQLNFVSTELRTEKKALDKMSNEEKQELSTEECKPLDKMSNGMFKNVQPIPDINSDIKIIETTTTVDNKNNIDLKNKTVKSSSSSSKYEFLKNYDISAGTKLNICRYITNLTEEKFADIYKQTKASYEAGEINSFEAVLYKALKGEWTFVNRSADVSDTVEKDRKYVRAQADYWLSYLQIGYSENQVLHNFLNAVHNCDENIVAEYKNKILNYFKRGA